MVHLCRRWSMQFVTKSTLANRDVPPAVVAWRWRARGRPARFCGTACRSAAYRRRRQRLAEDAPRWRGPRGRLTLRNARTWRARLAALVRRRRVNARHPRRKVRTRCKRVRSTVGCVGTRAVARLASRPSGDDRSQSATSADDPPTWHGTKRSASAGTCNEQLLLSFGAARASAAAGVPSRQGQASPARRSGSAGGVRGRNPGVAPTCARSQSSGRSGQRGSRGSRPRSRMRRHCGWWRRCSARDAPSRGGSDPPCGAQPCRVETVPPTHRRTDVDVVKRRFEDGLLARQWQVCVCRVNPAGLVEHALERGGSVQLIERRVCRRDAQRDRGPRGLPLAEGDGFASVRCGELVQLRLVAVQVSDRLLRGGVGGAAPANGGGETGAG